MRMFSEHSLAAGSTAATPYFPHSGKATNLDTHTLNPGTLLLILLFSLCRDPKHSMRMSGGDLLVPGSTGTTPYFLHCGKAANHDTCPSHPGTSFQFFLFPTIPLGFDRQTPLNWFSADTYPPQATLPKRRPGSPPGRRFIIKRLGSAAFDPSATAHSSG